MYSPRRLNNETFTTLWTKEEARLYFRMVHQDMEKYYEFQSGKIQGFYNTPNARVSLLMESLKTDIENLPVSEWLKLVGNFGAEGKSHLGLLRLENMMRRRLLERYSPKTYQSRSLSSNFFRKSAAPAFQ